MRKIITNKFFILALLISLFVIISSVEGNTFFKKEESKTIEQNKIIDEEFKKERITEDKEETIEENTISGSLTPTKATIQESSESNPIDFLTYPNSTVITKTNSSLTLESDKNADEITDWYKDKIEEYDMNATSTIKTNTNGNVLNKISASNGSLKIEVEISASNSSNLVKIVAKLL